MEIYTEMFKNKATPLISATHEWVGKKTINVMSINLHRCTYALKNASTYSTVIWIAESEGVEIGSRGKRSQIHGD